YGLGITFIIKTLLPLPYHSKCIVIDNDYLNRQIPFVNNRELMCSHLEPAIAYDRNYQIIRCTKLCSDCRRKPKAHCPKATRSNPAIWFIKIVKLSCPHLMLPNICGDNRFTIRYLIYLF